MQYKSYKYNGYRLAMKDTYEYDKYGKSIVSYTLYSPTKEVIFKGNDLHVSPMHAPLSKASAGALLGFLTLQKGDTDAEYFENYTPRQLEFAQNEAEDLKLWSMELEGDI